MEFLRQAWSKSKTFRAILILALVWLFIRLAFQLIYTAGWFPEITGESGLPGDLPVYLGAAQRFQLRQELYPQDLSDSTYHYPYPPPFAMFSIALLWLPARWTAMLCFALLVSGYGLLYLLWMQIFQRLNLIKVKEKMVWLLPVWLIFSTFWSDLSYLNIGVLVALITTLLIKSILEERLGWSTFWLALLLLSKVMWIFPVALPLLLGRRRFFFKLMALACASYLAMVGLSMLVAGPDYIIRQYGEYFNHLHRLMNEFSWHVWGVTSYFGYNHSIKQIMVFIMGAKPWVLQLATLIKIILLIPLAMLGWRLLFKSPRNSGAKQSSPLLPLDLAFVLFLGAFIWLDIVWGTTLEVVVFIYLLATLEQRWAKGLVWGLFLPYAFLDVIRLLSYLIGGDSVYVAQGEYILTDPSIYFPLIMFVILLFYALLIGRLWQTTKNLSVRES